VGQQPVQHGAPLLGFQGMDRTAGGFLHRHPAPVLSEHLGRGLGIDQRQLVFGSAVVGDFQAGGIRQGLAFLEPSADPIHEHWPGPQQPARLGSTDPENVGQALVCANDPL
jgi:hypothetical protein